MSAPQPMTLEEARDKNIFINVYFKGRWVPAGAITFNEAAGFSGFSYFDSYLQSDHPPLNPATLNHRDTNSRHFIVDSGSNQQMLDRTFWELLPTTGDFGHQALVSRFPQYHSMNHAQKLYFLGNRTVGGLQSYTKRAQDELSLDSLGAIDDVRKDAVSFQLKEATRLRANADSFLAMTSYGGVRPKAMYKDDQGRFWIAKFNLPTDPYDMAVAEHVAMNMARAAGMKTPETKVVRLPSGENMFLTERFDRVGEHRKHSLSLFALFPGVETGGAGPKANTAAVVATIIRRFSDFKDQDSANLILKFLVDIGFNNIDNHLRNTRVILNEKGLWELSPAFDITFNPRSQPHVYNPSGLSLQETFLHNDNLLASLGQQLGVDRSQVEEARAQVVAITEKWESFCDAANMSPEDKAKIGAAVNLGLTRSEIAHRIQADHRKKIEQVLRSQPKPR